MHFRILILPSNFMKVLNIIRKHYTNNEYFPKHMVFTMIYLLQQQQQQQPSLLVPSKLG
jgi:hypothetical protein